MPKGWQALIMAHSAQNRAALKKPSYQFPAFRPPALLTKAQRPALLFAEIGDWPLRTQFLFRHPILQSYSLFMARFYALAPGECLWLRQDFAILQPQAKSRLGKWMQTFNHLLQKMSFSYRWVEIATYETELLTAKEIRDFLFYFVLEHEAAIQDYFLEQVGEQICFVVCKTPKEEKTLVRKGRKP
ncbi:MAG: hypothetical protein HC913_11515 [Microscillaceae bacterium]|nr:hypothetical protein [Microscillaceae bacterium]